ncbi:hypothetical protein NDU88_000563, partial [Pleurodeles waltl]
RASPRRATEGPGSSAHSPKTQAMRMLRVVSPVGRGAAMALWRSWGRVYLAALVCSWLEMCLVSALSLEPIYWNTQNK